MSDEAKETIERAAVLKDGVIYDVPRPLRHWNAINKAADALGLEVLGEHEQGFVTSKGRFARRRAAMHIAREAGQLKGDLGADLLYSEDVW